MMRKVYLWLCGMLLAQPLFAGVMRPLPIQEMTGKSALVVHGKVIDKSCQRDSSGRIYTSVRLQVVDVWKGDHSDNQLTIVHGGGEFGGERVAVSHQVDYQIGEEVVAFCVLNQRGQAVTLGLCQGKFQVWQDDSGEWRVRNPFHGIGKSSVALRSVRSSDTMFSSRLSLTELKAQVRGKAETK